MHYPKHRNQAIWTDNIDYLPTWREIFDLTGMAEKGLSFESFMAQPWAFLRAHGQEQAVTSMAKGHRPLLPKQAEVAQRLLAEELDEGEDLKHAVNHWGYY
jgi:LPS sulfotransferase NodH